MEPTAESTSPESRPAPREQQPEQRGWRRVAREFLNGNLVAGVCGAAVVALVSWITTGQQIEAAAAQQRKELESVFKQLRIQHEQAMELAERQHALALKQLEFQDRLARDQMDVQVRREQFERERDAAIAARQQCIDDRQQLRDARRSAFDALTRAYADFTSKRSTAALYETGATLIAKVFEASKLEESDTPLFSTVEEYSVFWNIIRDLAGVIGQSETKSADAALAKADFQTALLAVAASFPKDMLPLVAEVDRATPTDPDTFAAATTWAEAARAESGRIDKLKAAQKFFNDELAKDAQKRIRFHRAVNALLRAATKAVVLVPERC